MSKRLITILAAFAALTLSGSQIFAHDLAVSGGAIRSTHAATVATATQDGGETANDEDKGAQGEDADEDKDTDKDTDEDKDTDTDSDENDQD